MRKQKGNALIEFALSFALLWACFAGVFQYGYSMYVYNSLVCAVSSGAIFASRAVYDTRNTNFQTQVQNMVVYGDPNGGRQPVAPGLTTALVSVTASPAAGAPETITVSIINFQVDAVFRKFKFNGKPSCTVKFAGAYMTPES